MSKQIILRIVFSASVLAMLALGPGIFHCKTRTIGVREALAWNAVWIALALLYATGW